MIVNDVLQLSNDDLLYKCVFPSYYPVSGVEVVYRISEAGLISVFRKLSSPPAHPNLSEPHDGTPQNFVSQKGGTKLYMNISMYLHINVCPIMVQAYENKTTHVE
jgi:hypothetical protein